MATDSDNGLLPILSTKGRVERVRRNPGVTKRRHLPSAVDASPRTKEVSGDVKWGSSEPLDHPGGGVILIRKIATFGVVLQRSHSAL